jgi:hypothetical protein
MKKAFYFMLGIALIILTSATTVSVMTVKPATPKHFIVKHFYETEKQSSFIGNMMKKGWILKSQSLAGGDSYIYGIVVMEKY